MENEQSAEIINIFDKKPLIDPDSYSDIQRAFDSAKSSMEIKPRVTIMMLTLHTYGTIEQCDQSIHKIGKELRIQGFNVEISDIHTTTP